MKGKKLWAWLLAALMLLGMTACGGQKEPNSSAAGGDFSDISEPSSTPDTESSTPESPDPSSTGSMPATTTTKKPATVPTTKRPAGGTPVAGTKVFKAEDYGAKGDGKTDDGPAIAKAVEAACRDGSSQKIIELKANTTYRVMSNGHSADSYLLLIEETNNITVRGNNTRLLMKAPMRVCRVADSQNITLNGLVIDYSPKPYAIGKVVSVASDYSYVDISSDTDLGFTGTVTPSKRDYFMFRNKTDERMHFFLSKMSKNSNGSYRFYINTALTSTALVKSQAPVGMEMIVPVYGSAHIESGILLVQDTDTFTMQNVKIHAAPDFVYGMRRCTGKVTFKNVRLEPAAGCPPLVSWRDGFHIKDNTAKIVWDNCYMGPLGDDAINLSCVIGCIDSVNTANGLINMTPAEDTADRAGLINPGDEIVIYDMKGGANDAVYCKIVSVLNTAGNSISIRVDADLSKIPNINTRYVGFYAYNKDYEINNCTIEGTVRLRSSGTINNTKFNVFWVRIENESAVEGPIPKNISFNHCVFSTPYSNPKTPVLVLNTQKSNGQSAAFRVRNIVLNDCTFNNCIYVKGNHELTVK